MDYYNHRIVLKSEVQQEPKNTERSQQMKPRRKWNKQRRKTYMPQTNEMQSNRP